MLRSLVGSEMCIRDSSGDFATAEKLDQKLMPLHRNLFLESNPIPVKYAVAKMGYTANVLRLPLTSIAAKFEAEVDAAIHSIADDNLV